MELGPVCAHPPGLWSVGVPPPVGGPMDTVGGGGTLVARLWTYHRLYDDLLILVPLITLFGIVRKGSRDSGKGITARVLLVLGCLGMLAPGTLLRQPFPWGTPF